MLREVRLQFMLALFRHIVILWCKTQPASDDFAISTALPLSTARAVFFLLLPRYGGVFFLVQITSDEAPLWLTALDELPSLFTLLVLGVLAQTWCVERTRARADGRIAAKSWQDRI